MAKFIYALPLLIILRNNKLSVPGMIKEFSFKQFGNIEFSQSAIQVETYIKSLYECATKSSEKLFPLLLLFSYE